MRSPLAPAAFAVFAAVLRDGSGMSLREHKTYLLRARLAPIQRRLGLPDLEALARLLAQTAQTELAREVTEAMTTNESLFFRDGASFAHLFDHGLPRIHAARPDAAAPIRIWSAGVSSGQEAYSLAMIATGPPRSACRRAIRIVATDIARAPLAQARAGRYSDFEVSRGLPAHFQARFFFRDGQRWFVRPELKAPISFREHNLLDSASPLGQFDVVFCRNVLIYLDPAARRLVLDNIAAGLSPDGLLYLGGGESLKGITDRFVALPGEHGVFTQHGG